MRRIFPLWIATVLVSVLFVNRPSEVRASDISEPITFFGNLSAPVNATGSTFTLSWSGVLGLSLTPVAAISSTAGDLLTVTCPGTVQLNLSNCDMTDRVGFLTTSNGTLSTAAQETLGLKIGFSLFGYNFGTGTVNAPVITGFDGTAPIGCFGFTPATLSLSKTPTLYSVNALKDLGSAIGISIPSWLASFTLSVDADITLQQQVTCTEISTAVGAQFACAQTMAIGATINCVYELGEVFAHWNDKATVGEGLAVSVSASILFFSWKPAPWTTGPLLNESVSIQFESDPEPPIDFILPQYSITVQQTTGGTVSPSSPDPLTVCQGQCITFTATPDAGYYVCGWKVDGKYVSVGILPQASSHYTLSDIQANHTVTAAFCSSTPIYNNNWNYQFSATLIGPVTNISPYTGSQWVQGLLNPQTLQSNGVPPGGIAGFMYGTIPGNYFTNTPPFSVDALPNGTVVSNELTGLQPNTTYYYTLVLSNAAGVFDGGEQSFTTAAIPPSTSTSDVTMIDSATVQLNGSLNANNLPTQSWFVWGPTTNVNLVTESVPFDNVVDDANSVLLTNLAPGTVYYYQLIASNAMGVTESEIESFVTPGAVPSATDATATNVAANMAVMQAMVNPNGVETVSYFVWGPTTNVNPTRSAAQFCGNGYSNILVSDIMEPLAPNTSYFFYVVASNALGVTSNAYYTFSTPGPSNAVLIAPQFQPGVGIQFLIAGSLGQTYTVQTTTNLAGTNWVTLTNITMVTNIQQFIDSSVTNSSSQKFYRIISASASQPGLFTQLQVLMPGEASASGTPSGKTGTPTSHAEYDLVNVTVNGCDSSWNVVTNATDLVNITCTDPNALVSGPTDLIDGAALMPLYFGTSGTFTVTASDLDNPNILPSTGSATVAVP